MVCFSEKVSLETFKTTLEIIKKKKKVERKCCFWRNTITAGTVREYPKRKRAVVTPGLVFWHWGKIIL